MAFYVLQHGWYMTNNSVPAPFSMLSTSRSCGNICYSDQNYQPGAANLENSSLLIRTISIACMIPCQRLIAPNLIFIGAVLGRSFGDIAALNLFVKPERKRIVHSHDIESVDNLCADEEEGHQDVNEHTCIEFSMRNRYGTLHDVVQEECNNDHVAHLEVRQKEQSNFDYSYYSYSTNQDILRPSYYILRLLGLWIPATSGCLWKFYHYFVVLVLWLGTITANIMLCYRDSKFHWEMFLNSLTTSVTLGCPYWFCWIYLRKGNYDGLLKYLTNTNKATHDKVKLYSKIYTFLSLFLWILGGVFFYFHWIPLFRGFKWTLLFYVLYFIVGFLSTGWWASWLGLYGFVCHLHKLQIDRFCRELNYMYGYSNRSMDVETSTVAILLDKFHDIRFWLDKTHKMFRFMISIAIIYHFVDLFIFTFAYWTHDFGDDYGTWHFIGGVAFNILSILANLYPAAMIGQALHATVFYAGEHCDPNADLIHLPKQRFVFFRYVFLREENLGLHVLGVKITSSLTVGFVMTLITAGLTFLKYAIPFIENLNL